MKFQFNNHQDYVGACEQLADDLVSFDADSRDFITTVRSPLTNEETIRWLEKVAQKVE